MKDKDILNKYEETFGPLISAIPEEGKSKRAGWDVKISKKECNICTRNTSSVMALCHKHFLSFNDSIWKAAFKWVDEYATFKDSK